MTSQSISKALEEKHCVATTYLELTGRLNMMYFVICIVGIIPILARVRSEAEAELQGPLPASAPESISEWPTCDTTLLGGQYSVLHPRYCDRFFACQSGVSYLLQCEDGFGYVPFRGCKLLHLVDCSDRTKLQPPRGHGDCPRLYGLYNDPKGCGRFFKCVNGTGVPDRCPTSLIFDDNEKVCREATAEEKAKCTQPALLGCTIAPDGVHYGTCTWFQCPVANVLPFGDHSRHPYPGHCRYYIMCLRDGSIKIGGCVNGTAFSTSTSTCEPEANANCRGSS